MLSAPFPPEVGLSLFTITEALDAAIKDVDKPSPVIVRVESFIVVIEFDLTL